MLFDGRDARARLHAKTLEALQRALHHLDNTLHNTPTQPNMDKAHSIRDELLNMIDTVQSYNPYDDISIDFFYSSLSCSVVGMVRWTTIS